PRRLRGGARAGAARGRREERRRGAARGRGARVPVTGILGGTFDPPQTGHVALARAARAELPIDRLLVLVAAAPRHREVGADAQTRLRLAAGAFEGLADEFVLDPHPFTVDAVRSGRFGDAIFVV